MSLQNAANRKIGGSSFPLVNTQSAMYAPAVRGEQMDAPYIGIPPGPAPAGGIETTIGGPATATQPAAPVRNPTPAPNLPTGVADPSAGLTPPTRSPRVQMDTMDGYTPGDFTSYPGNAGRYLVDPYGNFLEGSADAYVRDALGQAPTQAPLDPTQANAIENQYLSTLAGLDASDAYTNQGFVEQQGYIDRNKTRSLTSLADSMADRGLSNSGIFFGQTGDVNNAALEQLNSATKSRDLMLSQNQTGRVSAGTDRANKLAQAQADALAAAVKNWQDRYNAELAIARERLTQAGLA
jgi:hypothetical protein